MRGGRAAQMEQPIYAGEHGPPGGSDDEEAPLLSRSGAAEGEGGETVSAELSRLRRENLMTSQELERVRAENERLRGGGGGGGGGAGAGAGGRGFDESRGRMMEEL